ncbi:redoxin domain-containing protein [Pirellulaceae bacterium SH449]
MRWTWFKNSVGSVALAIFCLVPTIVLSQTNESEPIVPQNLLKLIHTPEVQKELELDGDERLRPILIEIDRDWWPTRVLPEAKQVETIRALEAKLLAALKPLLTPTKLRRLREIEAQSQGTRALLRPELAKAIGLDEKQLLTIRTAFAETDVLARKLAAKQGSDPTLEKQVQTVRDKEQRTINDLLTAANRQSLRKLIGEPFDTMSLKRIYPLAPELVDSGEWAGSGRASMESERGKVILIHFYAFQCHNCVANFDHYNRWQESLFEKGVSVIGIQTPETKAEGDPTLVKKAAIQKGFQFPVLIDLEKANWDAWGNTMWPTVYVVDKNGYIRSWWQGELNWQGATGDKTIEKLIDELLAE